MLVFELNVIQVRGHLPPAVGRQIVIVQAGQGLCRAGRAGSRAQPDIKAGLGVLRGGQAPEHEAGGLAALFAWPAALRFIRLAQIGVALFGLHHASLAGAPALRRQVLLERRPAIAGPDIGRGRRQRAAFGAPLVVHGLQKQYGHQPFYQEKHSKIYP